MSEILTIPAGVIQPKDLLLWLRGRRDEAHEMWIDVDDPDEAAVLAERVDTYSEVIQHISFGGAS